MKHSTNPSFILARLLLILMGIMMAGTAFAISTDQQLATLDPK